MFTSSLSTSDFDEHEVDEFVGEYMESSEIFLRQGLSLQAYVRSRLMDELNGGAPLDLSPKLAAALDKQQEAFAENIRAANHYSSLPGKHAI